MLQTAFSFQNRLNFLYITHITTNHKQVLLKLQFCKQIKVLTYHLSIFKAKTAKIPFYHLIWHKTSIISLMSTQTIMIATKNTIQSSLRLLYNIKIYILYSFGHYSIEMETNAAKMLQTAFSFQNRLNFLYITHITTNHKQVLLKLQFCKQIKVLTYHLSIFKAKTAKIPFYHLIWHKTSIISLMSTQTIMIATKNTIQSSLRLLYSYKDIYFIFFWSLQY